MKKYRNAKKFLDSLSRVPNVSMACRETKLSRNTIYRWRKTDQDFCDRMDEALYEGVDSVNDLAEGKLIGRIQSGDMRAIRYWLDNNKRSYVRPRPGSVYDQFNKKKRITGFDVIIRHAEKSPTVIKPAKKKSPEGSDDLSPI